MPDSDTEQKPSSSVRRRTTTRSRKSYASRLSGSSFKGRFSSSSPLSDDGTGTGARGRTTSGSDKSDGGVSSSSSTLSSNSSSLPGGYGSLHHPSNPQSGRSSLNRIASAASNFQTYAARYIESIRPKSWGNRTGGNGGSGGGGNLSGNHLQAPLPHRPWGRVSWGRELQARLGGGGGI